MSNPSPLILAFGLEDIAKQYVAQNAPGAKIQDATAKDLDALMENPPNPPPVIIFLGINEKELPPVEAAQFFRAQFHETSIFFLSVNPTDQNRDALIKNGVNDVFVLTVDKDILKNSLQKGLSKAGSIRAYRTVKLVDFDPETKLDFELSLYLPMNNKHIKFNNAGESLGQERIEKFNKKKINSLYIDQADTQKFYDYTAEYLRKIGNDSALSATERQDKLQASVRSLLSGVLSDSGKEGTFETGKTFIADCDKIVKTYIMGAKTGSVYKQILSTLDESNGAYTHTGKVSTLASLFSLGLGIGKPEDLAAAGLLHDMGMANVPIEIQEKPE